MAAPNDHVSHYRLIERLSHGGMGQVWLAEDTNLPRRVVVKLLHPHLAADPTATGRLLREARAAASIDHPNVVTVYEAGIQGDQPFLVSQYLEGETLEQRLAHGPLPVAEAVVLARALADALAEVHALTIVHRDLKPANIVMTARGPRILDFGISALGATQGLTVTGEVMGTPFAMSPEQFRGEPADPRSDLWALGVIFHHALTGRRPFDGDQVQAVAYQVMSVEPPPPSRANPEVSPALDAIVARLLAKDTGTRYARAEDVLADLSALDTGTRRAIETPAPARPRVAVLYFEPLGSDPDDAFFAAGLTEDLIVDLARLAGLEVAARGEVLPYRGRGLPPRTVARELGAAYIVEGTVRRAGLRSRISAQLVHAADGRAIWAERYDRTLEDLFDVQADVSRRIVEALQVTLGPGEREVLERPPTTHREAYERYLQGRTLADQFRRSSNRLAEQALREALAIDPAFALAYAALADVLVRRVQLGWGDRAPLAEARAHAERALALDAGLPQSHVALARVLQMEGDPAGVLEHLRAADLLEAREPELMAWIGRTYMGLGRWEEALAFLERALTIHPRDVSLLSCYVDCLVAMDRREREPDLHARMREVLIDQLERNPHDTYARGLLSIALAQSGDHAAGIAQAERTVAEEQEDGRAFYNAACTFTYVGQHDRALEMLRRLVAMQPDYPRDWLRRDPDLTPLHAYPAFEEIAG
jgi:TolB-like protein/Tfp pilus assembly protein PilF